MTSEPTPPDGSLDVPGFPGYRVGPDHSVWAARPGGRWRRLSQFSRRRGGGPLVNLRLGGRFHQRRAAGLWRLATEMASPPAPRGEAHGRAKLDVGDVRLMRRLRTEGWTYPRLASRFGVSRSNVFYVLSGKTWTDA